MWAVAMVAAVCLLIILGNSVLHMKFVITDHLYDVVVIGGLLMAVAAAVFMTISAHQRRKQQRGKKGRTGKPSRHRT